MLFEIILLQTYEKPCWRILPTATFVNFVVQYIVDAIVFDSSYRTLRARESNLNNTIINDHLKLPHPHKLKSTYPLTNRMFDFFFFCAASNVRSDPYSTQYESSNCTFQFFLQLVNRRDCLPINFNSFFLKQIHS